jgi:subtilase family serine protease
MSNTRSSAWARPAELAEFRIRQRNRFDLNCESLESRQLLSTAATSATDPSQVTALPSLQVLPLVTTGPTGLSPQQIASAYGVNQIKFSGGKVTGNGAGQTIAIVTAYNDPNITSDLAAFDKQYGLSAPPSFTVANLGGTTTDAGWALETSLDVEWAHAMAPAAKILLVEASSASLSGLFSAVSYASKQAGVSVVSMSWGTTEFWGQWAYDSLFTTPTGHSGVTYVAASGDSGAWYGPMYPSSSPNVLAVGGTSLTISGSNYAGETAWSGSTGGFSGLDSYWQFYEGEPAYQTAALQAVGLNYGVRTTPDVSFNADPNSGVSVYDSVSYSGQSGWFQVGGTSAAAPAWAGLVAIADQGLATGGKAPLSGTQAQTDLYKLPSADFHDITTGYNGYNATQGYDLVTGLGSPKANLVIAGILSANGVSQTSRPTQTVAASTTSTTTSSRSHRFDQTGSSSSTTGATATTLTTTITVSSPASGTTAIQALTTSFSTAPAQPVTQRVAATATVSQSTASTSLPGQSLPEEPQPAPQHTSIEDKTAVDDLLDDAADGQSNKPVRETAPSSPIQQDAPARVPDQAPIPDAVPDRGLPADDLPPALPAEPQVKLALDQLDLALSQVSVREAARRLDPAAETSSEGAKAADDQSASPAMSALAGTAVLVAGGYRLVLGRSDRIRRRSTWGRLR